MKAKVAQIGPKATPPVHDVVTHVVTYASPSIGRAIADKAGDSHRLAPECRM
jgi:hypothetical protein